jgi:hypothetical protein
VNDDRLTDKLVGRILGWRLAPGRYIKSGRSWIPRSRFRPLVDIRDAFRLLDAVTADYSLVARRGGPFIAEVRLDGRVGKAFGASKARTITIALADALGFARPDERSTPTSTSVAGSSRRLRSDVDGI